jgi:hypothetical protein
MEEKSKHSLHLKVSGLTHRCIVDEGAPDADRLAARLVEGASVLQKRTSTVFRRGVLLKVFAGGILLL